MKKNVSAFVLKLSKNRYEDFRDSLEEFEEFAEAVTTFSYQRDTPLLMIICKANGTITHFANGFRGQIAGYGMRRLNSRGVIALSRTVPVPNLLKKLSLKTQIAARRVFEEGGLLPTKLFEEIVEALLSLTDEAHDLLNRFSARRKDLLERLSLKENTALAYQKDTINTALNIAGLDRSGLSLWTPKASEKPKSFLDGLSQEVLREDPMIMSDMRSIPGFEFIEAASHQSAKFQDERGVSLTVVLANRQPLEEQTGADLIYYNEKYEAFIFVQYKAMSSNKEGRAIFRYPEKQFDAEIARMNNVLTELGKIKAPTSRDGFRLNNNPFFLKFCPKIQFDADGVSMVKGMYIHLDYWLAISDNNLMIGPRGGKHISYENVGRYFDNTSFARIISDAWVGTTIQQSEALRRYITETLKAGRAITFAVKSDKKDPDRLVTTANNPNRDSQLDHTKNAKKKVTAKIRNI